MEKREPLNTVGGNVNWDCRCGRRAAIGCCYKASAKYIGEMMNEAEDDMYSDKKKFYEQFPMYKR